MDNLRRVNDLFGHLKGDRCLREVALAMERSVRAGDRCFRWGGDEFVVLMPGATLDAAGQVLGRMAESVGETCETPDGRHVGLTWAAAQLEPGSTAEDLLAAADLALLERKTEKRR
jgi:diguanylate cyclase (GGDEF)-like protein